MGVGRTAPTAEHGPRSTNAGQRHLLDSCHRRVLARSARTLRTLADGIRPLLAMVQEWRLCRPHRGPAGQTRQAGVHRLGTMVRRRSNVRAAAGAAKKVAAGTKTNLPTPHWAAAEGGLAPNATWSLKFGHSPCHRSHGRASPRSDAGRIGHRASDRDAESPPPAWHSESSGTISIRRDGFRCTRPELRCASPQLALARNSRLQIVPIVDAILGSLIDHQRILRQDQVAQRVIKAFELSQSL